SLLGDAVEPDLHLIDPGSVGRSEVHVESWSASEPAPHSQMLVCGVIVYDDVHVQVCGHALLNFSEETQIFPRTKPLHFPRDLNTALQNPVLFLKNRSLDNLTLNKQSTIYFLAINTGCRDQRSAKFLRSSSTLDTFNLQLAAKSFRIRTYTSALVTPFIFNTYRKWRGAYVNQPPFNRKAPVPQLSLCLLRVGESAFRKRALRWPRRLPRRFRW